MQRAVDQTKHRHSHDDRREHLQHHQHHHHHNHHHPERNTITMKRSACGGGGGAQPPTRAYVTFLAGASGGYVKGVVGLAKGLRKARSAYPLVVAILDDVPEEHRHLLRAHGCIIRPIPPIGPPSHACEFAMPHYVINYSKLRLWEFVEYERIIYLDADIMVYDNIDHLFELPKGRFYAVMDCFCEPTWSHSPQYKVQYCQQCPEQNPWPKHLGAPPANYFNAGMFVHEPNKKTFDRLMERLHSTLPTPFAEQDFLNLFFQDIYTPIPLIYNLVMAMLWRHPEKVKLDELKVVHYCATGSKPWSYTGKEENMDREDLKFLVQKWWNVYNDKSLDQYPSRLLFSSNATREFHDLLLQNDRLPIPKAA